MPTPFLCEYRQLPGTSFSEGIHVSIAPEPDERVRFFRLDQSSFRERYDLRAKKVCDLLIEYCHEAATPVDLFTELKGAHFNETAAQIETAFSVLKGELRGCQPEVEFRALIVSSAASPPNRKSLQKRMHKIGLSVRFKTGVKRGVSIGIRQYVT